MLWLVRDVLGTALVPARTFRRWLEKPKPLGRALWTVAGTGVLYALTSLGLAVSGAVPLVPPFFRLPDGNYYFWQMIFVGPGFLLTWIAASGLLRLFGPGKGPRKLLREAASLAGPSLAVPLLAAWLPQAVQAVLMVLGMNQEEFVEIVSEPGIWQVLHVGSYAIACVWAILLFTRAARLSQSAGRWKSIIAGVLTAAMTGISFVLFLR